jgi:hypothetical protein
MCAGLLPLTVGTSADGPKHANAGGFRHEKIIEYYVRDQALLTGASR